MHLTWTQDAEWIFAQQPWRLYNVVALNISGSQFCSSYTDNIEAIPIHSDTPSEASQKFHRLVLMKFLRGF